MSGLSVVVRQVVFGGFWEETVGGSTGINRSTDLRIALYLPGPLTALHAFNLPQRFKGTL